MAKPIAKIGMPLKNQTFIVSETLVQMKNNKKLQRKISKNYAYLPKKK